MPVPLQNAETGQVRITPALIAGVLSCLCIAQAQITIITKVGDKTIACGRSGLTGDLKDCDAQTDWYTYVFVGSISGITSVENGESEIRIVPVEVFHGDPAPYLTVLTRQAECGPKLAIGDRWLLFLRKEKGKSIVVDVYASESRPVADALQQIETLRRLESIGNFGILRGKVRRGGFFEGGAVAHARVVARRISDGLQFVSKTGADGRYEFEPLPPGKYKITVDRVGSFRADDSEVDLSRGACRDLTLTRSPHAQLAGHVQCSDGSPVVEAGVILISADDSWFYTSQTDARGYFVFDSLRPGQYVVGINLPGAPAWKHGGGAGPGLDIPTASSYFRNEVRRSDALVIKLATDEQRNDIDFIVPAQ